MLMLQARRRSSQSESMSMKKGRKSPFACPSSSCLTFLPMRNQVSSWFVAIALASLCVSGFADTVTLKSGEKLEGKITGETATEISMDVKISAGITDSRTIPKAEVAKVEKEQPDVIAWQALKNLKPGANSLPTAASYEPFIRSLRGFATQFPNSAHTADAQKAATAFEEEKKRVEAGEVKLSGNWITKEEAVKDRYQINAAIAFNYMKDQSTRGDLPGALNTFTVIESQYPGSRIFPDAVELARRILPTLKAETDRRLPALQNEAAEREKGMALASDTQRAELVAALQREQASAEAALAAAEKQNLKWPPLIVRSEKSLTTLSSKAADAMQDLASVDVSKLRQSLQLVQQARASFDKKEYDAAEETARKAQELWDVNELATRLQSEIASAKSSTPPPPMPEDPNAPAASVDIPPAPEGQPAPTAATEAAPAESAPAEEAGAVEEQAEEKPFFLTLGGAITVVVLGALVFVAIGAYKKIKARANEVLE